MSFNPKLLAAAWHVLTSEIYALPSTEEQYPLAHSSLVELTIKYLTSSSTAVNRQGRDVIATSQKYPFSALQTVVPQVQATSLATRPFVQLHDGVAPSTPMDSTERIATLTITEKPLAAERPPPPPPRPPLEVVDDDEDGTVTAVFVGKPVRPPVEPSGASHEVSSVLPFE
jgi:hypothetical protein